MEWSRKNRTCFFPLILFFSILCMVSGCSSEKAAFPKIRVGVVASALQLNEIEVNGIVEGLKMAGRLDGEFLALDGGMAITALSCPEGGIASRIRTIIGAGPIAATFDPHGNESEEFPPVADGAFVTKQYPHSDRAGNSTHRLRELIHQNAKRFRIATIADERVLRSLEEKHKVGAEFEIAVGGYADCFAREPVWFEGILEFLGPDENIPETYPLSRPDWTPKNNNLEERDEK